MHSPNLKNILVDDAFNLFVEFADGEMRCVNLKTWVDGKSKIKESLDFCKQAFIEEDCIISWPNGVSIDPEIIYKNGKKITSFPKTQFPATGSYYQKVKAVFERSKK